MARYPKASGNRYAPYIRTAGRMYGAAKKAYGIYSKVRTRYRNSGSRTKQKRNYRKKYGGAMGSSIPGRCGIYVRKGRKDRWLKNLTKNSPPRLLLNQSTNQVESDAGKQGTLSILQTLTRTDFMNMKATLPAISDTGLGSGAAVGFATVSYYMDIALKRLKAEILITNTCNSVVFVKMRTWLCKKSSNASPLEKWGEILNVQNANVIPANKVLTTTYGATPYMVDGFNTWWKCVQTRNLRLAPGEIYCHNHIDKINKIIRGSSYEAEQNLYIRGLSKVVTITIHGEPTQDSTGVNTLSGAVVNVAGKRKPTQIH
ncbi:capsid protein [Sewage-associated circular DNA virus-23]|uniref:capsid protein n=1 Tax=Sewage-associated circular DNA virus-23 TaxID=1592090 RepID=UPI000585CF49|nr:capsid protein [Sewage-associated circular DNA virus-23]AJD07538.1 capsid protein [Sewage-associated circular DNA virus-23]